MDFCFVLHSSPLIAIYHSKRKDVVLAIFSYTQNVFEYFLFFYYVAWNFEATATTTEKTHKLFMLRIHFLSA